MLGQEQLRQQTSQQLEELLLLAGRQVLPRGKGLWRRQGGIQARGGCDAEMCSRMSCLRESLRAAGTTWPTRAAQSH